jgi:hypothetical protein
MFYVGYLLMDNGHWKNIQGINTDRCTPPTIRRLAENLKTAEAFFRRRCRNPSLQIKFLTSSSPSFTIKQTNGKLTSLPYTEKRHR